MNLFFRSRTLLAFYIFVNISLFLYTKSFLYSDTLTMFAWLFLLTQSFHSIEEQLGEFHSRWPLMKISANQFAIFEILFQFFWFLPFIFNNFVGREAMLWFFPLLMFANGIWHVVWFWFFEKCKKYVPGLITAPIFILLFIAFYLKILY